MVNECLIYTYTIDDKAIGTYTAYHDTMEFSIIMSLNKGDIVMIDNEPRKVLCKRYSSSHFNRVDIILE